MYKNSRRSALLTLSIAQQRQTANSSQESHNLSSIFVWFYDRDADTHKKDVKAGNINLPKRGRKKFEMLKSSREV